MRSAGRDWELVGVPYTSMKDPGGIARAIAVLRERGLADRLGRLGVNDGGDLALEQPDGKRGPSGVLNEAALTALVSRTRQRVSAAYSAGRVPLLIGGDCPVLLGALAAIRDRDGDPGLLMIDGHEDAWPPQRSDTGEGSDSEVAMALGRIENLPGPLAELLPLLSPAHLVMIGPRDNAEIAAAGVASLRDEAGLFVSGAKAAADPCTALTALAGGLEGAGRAFWLHVDLDVLSSEAFAAVDYPQPEGIGWDLLDALAGRALADQRCRGASVVIYNPELDPDGAEADKVVEFACRLVSSKQ